MIKISIEAPYSTSSSPHQPSSERSCENFGKCNVGGFYTKMTASTANRTIIIVSAEAIIVAWCRSKRNKDILAVIKSLIWTLSIIRWFDVGNDEVSINKKWGIKFKQYLLGVKF